MECFGKKLFVSYLYRNATFQPKQRFDDKLVYERYNLTIVKAWAYLSLKIILFWSPSVATQFRTTRSNSESPWTVTTAVSSSPMRTSPWTGCALGPRPDYKFHMFIVNFNTFSLDKWFLFYRAFTLHFKMLRLGWHQSYFFSWKSSGYD